MRETIVAVLGSLLVLCSGCGEDAIARGVGAACAMDTDCREPGQVCLTAFKGGYCGIAGCAADTDCPNGSACVADATMGMNFCFLVCTDKVDCNVLRAVDDEANCVSSVTFVDGAMGRKACEPPTGP